MCLVFYEGHKVTTIADSVYPGSGVSVFGEYLKDKQKPQISTGKREKIVIVRN